MSAPLATRPNAPVHPQAAAAIANGRKALDAGRFDDAVRALRKAAALLPREGAVHHALGTACLKAGRAAEAIAPMQCARDIAPRNFEYQLGLADAYYLANEPSHALPEYLRAAALRPGEALPWSNAGALHREAGRPDLALDALARALAIDPTHASALSNIALAFHDLGEFTSALDSVGLALHSRPDYPEALWNRAILDLLHGNFARGWAGHEFRTVQLAKLGTLRSFPHPRWTGERFDGKRLLLWPEQGLGDQLQFIRFLPRVKALGGTVVVMCSAPLVSLFRANCPDADEIVALGEPYEPVDLQLPLMSIPHVLQLRADVDGRRVPYVHATGDARERLNDLLPAREDATRTALRVGVCWAGQPKHLNDRNRSLTLETLRPLFDLPGIEWYSLQKGDAPEAQIAPFNSASLVSGQPSLTPLGDALVNFTDTSHAVSRLDVVLSVDTSVAHLAGAMGVPAWLLIPFVPDWRWQVERTDSPWYPSVQLFRQPRASDWASVVERVGAALQARVAARSAAPALATARP